MTMDAQKAEYWLKMTLSQSSSDQSWLKAEAVGYALRSIETLEKVRKLIRVLRAEAEAESISGLKMTVHGTPLRDCADELAAELGLKP
jgi:hypothetical protein